MKYTAQNRFEIITLEVRGEKNVSTACKTAGISRKTYYKWFARFAKASNKNKLKTLEDKKWVLTRHPRRVSSEIEKRVIDIVSTSPKLGYTNIQ